MLAEANTLLEIFKFQAPMGAEPPPPWAKLLYM